MLIITRESFEKRLRKKRGLHTSSVMPAGDVNVSVLYCPYCGHDEEYYSLLPYSCYFCGKVFKWASKIVTERKLDYQLKFYFEGVL